MRVLVLRQRATLPWCSELERPACVLSGRHPGAAYESRQEAGTAAAPLRSGDLRGRPTVEAPQPGNPRYPPYLRRVLGVFLSFSFLRSQPPNLLYEHGLTYCHKHQRVCAFNMNNGRVLLRKRSSIWHVCLFPAVGVHTRSTPTRPR